jgi:phage FluMu gp28-like protein
VFADESSALLTYELISQAEMPAERCGVICRGEWSAAALGWLKRAIGPLYVGMDVGRERDLTSITVIEKLENLFWLRALLELEADAIPAPARSAGRSDGDAAFPESGHGPDRHGDGLLEFSQENLGAAKIEGHQFRHERADQLADGAGRAQAGDGAGDRSDGVSEMLEQFVDRRVRIPAGSGFAGGFAQAGTDRLAERPGQSIAATRDEAGHADRFWSLALALYAARQSGGAFVISRQWGKSESTESHRGHGVSEG